MQLKHFWAIGLFALNGFLLAQNSHQSKEIEVDFLVNYYQQDGDHAAVTGGNGTEKLHDTAPMIIVNVPIGNNSLNVATGVDFYSSASSDNIDPIRSGASGSDARAYANVDYTINNASGNGSYGFLLGGSAEYDYTSFSFGGKWATASADDNRELALSGRIFFDRAQLIYPIELRNGTDWLSDGNRRTYNVSASYSQVLSQRAQISLMSDVVYQSGLLSTPFHRVYFTGESRPRVEKLPDSRIKIPVGARLNYYVNDWLISRLYYRFYWDDFGIQANTAEIELPVAISQSVSITPFYRYHKQSAADDYRPFGEHNPGDEFYTSDHDLSDFNSHKVGLGLRYYPVFGVADFGSLLMKRLDFRFSVYDRSDGLSAFSVGMGVSFIVK